MTQLTPAQSKLEKLRRYLRYRDFTGLSFEIEQYVRWQMRETGRRLGYDVDSDHDHLIGLSEDKYWDETDIDKVRDASWLAAGGGILSQWALRELSDGRTVDSVELVAELMETGFGPRRGLAIGCGDMVAEIGMFTHPDLPFQALDGVDVSFGSLERAKDTVRDLPLRSTFFIADMNGFSLPAEVYDLIVCYHAYHHLTEIEVVAQQINCALKPGGVFITFDYVGECFQQFAPVQLDYANQFNLLLPYRYRRVANGAVRNDIYAMDIEGLSPDEAIHSDRILPAMQRHLDIRRQYNWAGLLMPLLQGVGFNYSTHPDDIALLRFLFNVDRSLVTSGAIGPNFTITLATKRGT